MKYYKKGSDYAYEGNLEKAIKEFEKAISAAPRFIDAHLLLADTYGGLKNYQKAVEGFEKVLSIDPNYNPKIYYSLGLLHYKNKQYEKAVPVFEKFLTYPQKSQERKARIEELLENSRFAAVAVKNPVPFKPVNMGKNINTEMAEYSPSITVDGEQLFYTVKLGRQEDFFISKKENGQWQKAKNLGPPINTDDNEGAQTISADGKYLVYTACNRRGDYGSCDLYFSEFKNERWTKPANIGAPVSSSDWESQPSLSANADELYFTSSRPGGKGKKDIWVSKRSKDGKWGKPQSAGDNINTSGEDISPFIHPDGRTLYFVSDGHPGMGRSDIFFSRRQADGTWGKPENIGYPINTDGKEFSLIVSTDGKTAYFASDKEGGMGMTDLYSFELHAAARPSPVTYAKATVFDDGTKEKLVANVELIDLSTGKIHTISKTDKSGEFLVCLPSGTDYALNVNKTNYLFHSENFALKGKNTLNEPYLLEIGLQRIPEPVATISPAETPTKPAATALPEASKPIILRNVFFETGSAELKDESRTELNKLRDLLNEHPGISIQINGHTDNVGSDSDNMTLSDNRAKAVFNFLVQNSISASRLRSKGFGETQPIDTNDTDAGRANNRRTEFVILK